LSIWFNSTATFTGAKALISQADSGPTQMARLTAVDNPSGDMRVRGFVASDPTSENVRSTSDLAFNNSKNHQILMTFVAGDLNVFIDGAEVVYQSGENSKIGAGGDFSSMGTFGSLCSIGDFSYTSGAFDGRLFRFKAWDGTILTPAEVLEEYNNELALLVNPLNGGGLWMPEGYLRIGR